MVLRTIKRYKSTKKAMKVVSKAIKENTTEAY